MVKRRPAPRVGVRRSPRAHTHAGIATATASTDEEEAELERAEPVVVATTSSDEEEAGLERPKPVTMATASSDEEEAELDEEAEPVGMATAASDEEEAEPVATEMVVEDNSDAARVDGWLAQVERADDDDDEDTVDVMLANDGDNASTTTHSLSVSLSPGYHDDSSPRAPSEPHGDDGPVTGTGVGVDSSKSLLDDEVTSVASSEADSVDVVDDRLTADTARKKTLLQAHGQPTSDAPMDVGSSGTGLLGLAGSRTEPRGLMELEEFVSRSGKGGNVTPGGVATETGNLSRAGDELPTGKLMTSTVTDVRRGAMWKDSLFPSDFPPPENPATTAGKFGGVAGGKPDLPATAMHRPMVEWETGSRVLGDNRVAVTPSVSGSRQAENRVATTMPQSCRQDFHPPAPSTRYLVQI